MVNHRITFKCLALKDLNTMGHCDLAVHVTKITDEYMTCLYNWSGFSLTVSEIRGPYRGTTLRYIFLTNRKGKRKNHHGRRHLLQTELGRIFFRIDG